jgi:hypothetical protein
METKEKAFERFKKLSALNTEIYWISIEYGEICQIDSLINKIEQIENEIFHLFGLKYESNWQNDDPNRAIAIIKSQYSQPKKMWNSLVELSEQHFKSLKKASVKNPTKVEWGHRLLATVEVEWPHYQDLPIERYYTIYEYYMCILFNEKKISYENMLVYIEKSLRFSKILIENYDDEDIISRKLNGYSLPLFHEFIAFMKYDSRADDYFYGC